MTGGLRALEGGRRYVLNFKRDAEGTVRMDDDRAVGLSEVSLGAGDVVVSSPIEVATVPLEGAGEWPRSMEEPARSAGEVRERLVDRNRDEHAVEAHQDTQLVVTVDELADGFFAAVWVVHRNTHAE